MGVSRYLQPFLLLLTALLLDGGRLFRLVGTAAVAHWGLVLCLLLRGSRDLTKTDLELMRYGFYLWLALTVLLTAVIHGLTQ